MAHKELFRLTGIRSQTLGAQTSPAKISSCLFIGNMFVNPYLSKFPTIFELMLRVPPILPKAVWKMHSELAIAPLTGASTTWLLLSHNEELHS